MSADQHLSGLQFEHHRARDELGTTHYARIGNNVVGHAMTNHLPGEPVELAQIRVGDDYQGHGYGHQLLDHVIQHHAGSGMVLHASPFGNKAMDTDQLTRFYGQHGFKTRKNGDMTRRAR
jgi:GNAT superfamily N-acetyltransferase